MAQYRIQFLMICSLMVYLYLDSKSSKKLPKDRRLYDSEPPIIYTMMIIWDFILKNFIDVKQSRELSINKTVKLSLTVQQVHDKLSRFCPETNSSCLEMSWVKKALMGFVEIGIASTQADNKEFLINFKKHKGETIDWIFRSISKSSLIEKSRSTLDEFL